MEGTIASVPPQGGRKHPQQEFLQVDTTNILFICGGAFSGLDKVIARRGSDSSIGFGANVKHFQDQSSGELIKNLEPEDLIKYGLIPEFVGRMPILSTLQELDESSLVKILQEPKNSLIKQYKRLFEFENVELIFKDEAVLEIAKKAINKKTGFFLGLIILFVIAAYSLAINLPTFISKTPVLETGKALAQPMELVAFDLVDHAGEPFQYKDLKEEWSLIFFGYSKCPDVCPTTVFKLTEIYRILDEDKAVKKPQVIFVSIDPDRDKPETLKEYLTAFNSEFIGVTGTLDEIKKLTAKLSVYFQKIGDDEENYLYEMNHTAGLFLTNPDGKLVASFKPTATPRELSMDVKKILLLL